MKFSELIDHAIVCIKGFNPVIKTLDSHADEFIAQVSRLSNIPLHPTYQSMLTLFAFAYSSRIPTRRSSSSRFSTGARAIKNS